MGSLFLNSGGFDSPGLLLRHTVSQCFMNAVLFLLFDQYGGLNTTRLSLLPTAKQPSVYVQLRRDLGEMENAWEGTATSKWKALLDTHFIIVMQ